MSADTPSSGHFLRGEKVYLAAQDADREAETVASWSDNSEFQRMLSDSPARPHTTRYWAERLTHAGDNPTGYPFGIYTLANGRLIGFVVLWIMSWPAGEAIVAIGLGGRADWGQGYGTDAMRLALRYGFTELNLERVTLQAFSHNARGIRAYEKAGFVHEGQELEWLRRDGQRHGHINMGILRADWLRLDAEARNE